jgi:hypothetical protein
VRFGRRPVAVLTAVAASLAIALALEWRSRWPRLGPLRVTPAASRISVHVGESVQFSAAADGALGFTWSVWGHRVSSASTWSYVPGPEDAGWQQVSVEARGRRGRRIARAWDVGVLAAVAPELQELTPPDGRVTLPANEQATFRCSARLAAARPSDHLSFEWTLDGRFVLFERHPATEAASELLLLPPGEGTHRLRVSVTEDGRTASLADWTISVAPEEQEREPVQAAIRPQPGAPREQPPATEPEPRLVAVPDQRKLEAMLGEAMAFRVHVEPERADTEYRWIIDGTPSPRARDGELEYRPATAGRHRIAVTAEAGGRVVGRDAWTIVARAETPPAVEDVPPPPRAEPEPPPSTPAPLAEADVQRWLDEYARAWSRKDVATLRRMGQVRSAAEAERLARYFGSIGALEVDVHLLAVHVDGDRAAVEFERVDTVTDPAGRRQQLRLPPMRKQIERTPDGLRFAHHEDEG